jgi:HlyD family secretion protein
MKLVISVDESDIGKIKKGQHVTFTVSAYPERTFSGTIKQVRMNPVPKGGVVTYQSTVICDNSDLLLKPGMTATVIIEIEKKDNVLHVPNQAFMVSPVPIDVNDRQKYVWKKTEKLLSGLPVERIPISTGLQGDKNTEIIGKKLKIGEKILIKYVKK